MHTLPSDMDENEIRMVYSIFKNSTTPYTIAVLFLIAWAAVANARSLLVAGAVKGVA